MTPISPKLLSTSNLLMRNSRETNLKYYLEMFKLKIMIPVSLTGFTGYFIFDPHISTGLILITIGILCIAISASVLNQIQETDIDALMNRTRNRPIPTGRISREKAFVIAVVLFSAGLLLIYSQGNNIAALIALFTLLWYNGVYTLLKRKSAFAVVPGALTGALPPVIGWVAAGGHPFSLHIIAFALLLFIIQIPHFWIFILNYGDEYLAAGVPNISSSMSPSDIRVLIYSLIVTSAIAAIFLSPAGIISNEWITGILILSSLVFLWQFSHFLRNSETNNRRYSMMINVYILLIMTMMITDRVIQNMNMGF